jgi:hypothetical protein
LPVCFYDSLENPVDIHIHNSCDLSETVLSLLTQNAAFELIVSQSVNDLIEMQRDSCVIGIALFDDGVVV